jgi:hypothetical protein
VWDTGEMAVVDIKPLRKRPGPGRSRLRGETIDL